MACSRDISPSCRLPWRRCRAAAGPEPRPVPENSHVWQKIAIGQTVARTGTRSSIETCSGLRRRHRRRRVDRPINDQRSKRNPNLLFHRLVAEILSRVYSYKTGMGLGNVRFWWMRRDSTICSFRNIQLKCVYFIRRLISDIQARVKVHRGLSYGFFFTYFIDLISEMPFETNKCVGVRKKKLYRAGSKSTKE